jgi:acyl carrier protein
VTTPGETQALLTALLRELLDNPSLEPQADDTEENIPGFDSGAKILLILTVEERFDIRLRSREVDGLRRFGDWVDLLHRRLAPG